MCVAESQKMKRPNGIIEIKEHGTGYFVDECGRLAGYPMRSSGGVDTGIECEIEQSPISFKEGHLAALRKLGVPEGLIPGILEHMHYY